MASCITSHWANDYSPQVRLTITQTNYTNEYIDYSWKLEYIAGSAAKTSVNKTYSASIDGTVVASGSYNINGKTGTYTIASGTTSFARTRSTRTISFSCSMAFNLTWSGTYSGTRSASGSFTVKQKPTYTITYYANGGSGAPSSQTKWHNENITLSSTKPTRTGYTFQGWSSGSTGSVTHSPGETISNNLSISLYAVWKANTYTVSYNANGGSGAPSSQTKTYGVNLTLSSTKPTRTNYTFKGWGTSSSSTTVSYAAGATYSSNSAITLYAVWELSYKKPSISGFLYRRCTSSGLSDEDGAYFVVNFSWSTYLTSKTYRVKWKEYGTSTWYYYEYDLSGTSGTVRDRIIYGKLTPDKAYDIQIQVFDAGGSASVTKTLSAKEYLIDFLIHEHTGVLGVAFNKPADTQYMMDVNYNLKVLGRQYGSNEVLWSGAWYMHGTQTATLSSSVSKQPHGIVLVWSKYSAGAAVNSDFYYQFIPKYHVSKHAGCSISSGLLSREDSSNVGTKWVYVSDTTITGNGINDDMGGIAGGTMQNNFWVLRYVIGV